VQVPPKKGGCKIKVCRRLIAQITKVQAKNQATQKYTDMPIGKSTGFPVFSD